MKSKYFKLLGVSCLPLVKRSQYDISNWDSSGQIHYLKGEERIKYAKRVIDRVTLEKRKENKEQEWKVWSIHADGTFNLLSDMGYEQTNVSRNDFRIIK